MYVRLNPVSARERAAAQRGPTKIEAARMAARSAHLKDLATEALKAGDDARALEFDVEAFDIDVTLNAYGYR